jgi:hypothetical protein
MSNKDQKDFINTLTVRARLLTELLGDRTTTLNTMIENLKRFDGYALGAKESIDKIEEHIKKQKKELVDLVTQKKIPQEVGALIEGVLRSTSIFAKNVAMDAERLFFSKQGEVIFLKQEIEKLSSIKENHESALANIQKQQEEKQVEKVESQPQPTVQEKVESEKSEKVRPDKNPKTKIGRAAMDIMERKKKTSGSSEKPSENSSKKRGRKPKA